MLSPALRRSSSQSSSQIDGGGPVGELPAQQHKLGPGGYTKDAITQGKQKAQAVLAASGVQIETSLDQKVPSTRSRSPIPEAEIVPSNQAAVSTNGSTQSRKRSRSGSRIPARSPPTELAHRPRPTTQKLLLDQYVTRDQLHSAAMHAQTSAQMDIIRSKRKELEYYQKLRRERQSNPAAVFGIGYAGYGNGHTDDKHRIVYPFQRKRPGGRKTRELRVPRKEIATQADQLEELIPVRLDIEWDKVKLRDTFTWNLHDRVISPELFAEQLVEDFKLPLETSGPVMQQVCHALRDQIQDFYPQVFIDEEALDPHLPYFAYKNDEMRILIKLNITIGQHTLVDQFEWEINNPINSAEEFAKQMTRDLALSGEFTTAIAHSIREQSQLFTKSLYITGHPFDGRPIDDADLKAGFLPSPLASTNRPMQQHKDFTPYLYELNEADLERAELSFSREQRRQKRSVNRRGGPILPDLKDRQRTVRTLIVSSILPGAAETLEDTRLFKRVGVESNRGRRAAARQKDGADDSDESESDDSAPDSPAMSSQLLSGTARTRGMRGAASAAQAAMRANLGRSATPEASILHHHETRTSARRFFGRDAREESVGELSLVVKLKLPKDRFRQLLRERKSRFRGEQQGTPARGSMGPPPTTPGMHHQQLPSHQANRSTPESGGLGGQQQQQPGRGDVTYPPKPDQRGVSVTLILLIDRHGQPFLLFAIRKRHYFQLYPSALLILLTPLKPSSFET
ncbi:MAG: SWI/SNF chromatin-remodeling complex subunit [Candelina submexicana]|nr:MAG: SWI/SNF chromatin-remodeling complex subunit [Candelina submexicana]